MKKRTKVYLQNKQIDKLKSILVEQGRNPAMKKATLIREIIDESNFNEMYISDDGFNYFNDKFCRFNELNSKLNSLMYTLNIEHINYMQGKENEYVLKEEEFSPIIKEMHIEIIKLKEEIQSLSKVKRVV